MKQLEVFLLALALVICFIVFLEFCFEILVVLSEFGVWFFGALVASCLHAFFQFDLGT